MRRWLVLLSSVWLSACAATMPAPPPVLTTPRPLPPMLAPVMPPPNPVSWPMPSKAKSVEGALYQALQGPEGWRFAGGALTYDAEPYARYLIPVAVGRLTTLQLSQGETLFSVESGLPKCEDLKTDDPEVNLECLSISERSSGDGERVRYHVGLRPGREGLRTNLMLSTSLGSYDLEVVSGKRAVPVVRWSHPAPIVAPVDPRQVLGVGYTIASRTGTSPEWQPVAVWDDLRHTYVAFPPEMAGRAFPVLSAVDPVTREPQLVNYEVFADGQLLVVDRVLDAAVLRLGIDPHAQLVDIRRAETFRYVVCPGDGCPGVSARLAGR